MKRQPSEWEKIIANGTTDKGLISKIYKQPMQLKQKMGGVSKHTFLQRRYTNKMKRCSISLNIREMQIKNTMRYHLIPVSMAIIKKSANNKC